ncbi:MAG: DUF1730 domain-containing protein [Planctomycetaceae bacterium]|jgi:epoxyqueuosine reductase|nr:DUF1730 domain-containing protein [Planctomycetaceae bacterium]
MSFKLLADQAIDSGFQMVGVAAARRPKTFDAFERWIDRGMFAGMDYLAKGREARENPNFILNGVKSIIMLGVSFDRILSCSPLNFRLESSACLSEGCHLCSSGVEIHSTSCNNSKAISRIGRIGGIVDYARGIDYHFWIKERFKPILSLHSKLYPDDFCRGVVDTAPLLERQFAVDAGLGQIGKNTMLITPRYGSNVFLGAILSTINLFPAEPVFESNNSKVENISDDAISEDANNFCNENYYGQDSPCGECNRCIQVCPTEALSKPYVLDARLCLNYWTIEHCGEIPDEIQKKLNGRFFGCDTCRRACPYNKPFIKSEPESESNIDPNSLNENELRELAKGTPLERKIKRQLKKT